MGIEKLRVLEERIEDILAQWTALRAERDQLQQQLTESQDRVQALAAQLGKSEDERAQVKARVERLLERLDGLGLGG